MNGGCVLALIYTCGCSEERLKAPTVTLPACPRKNATQSTSQPTAPASYTIFSVHLFILFSFHSWYPLQHCPAASPHAGPVRHQILHARLTATQRGPSIANDTYIPAGGPQPTPPPPLAPLARWLALNTGFRLPLLDHPWADQAAKPTPNRSHLPFLLLFSRLRRCASTDSHGHAMLLPVDPLTNSREAVPCRRLYAPPSSHQW